MPYFQYLQHPAVVIQASWRKGLTKHCGTNVLLTNGNDGVIRLWCEHQPVESVASPIPHCDHPRFHLCCSIPLRVGSLVDWLEPPSMSSTFRASAPKYGQAPLSKRNSCSTINMDTGFSCHTVEACEGNPKDNLAARNLKSAFLDWFVGVLADGSVVVWRLRFEAYQMPTVTIWAREQLEGATYAADCVSLLPVCFARTPGGGAHSSPTGLLLFTHSTSGMVTCWSMKRQGTSLPVQMRVKTSGQLFGHYNAISSVVAHPSLPYAASIDYKCTALVWRCLDLEPFANPPFLRNLTTLADVHLLCWMPCDPVFAVPTKEGIVFYAVSPTDAPREVITRLPGAVALPGVMSLPEDVDALTSFPGADEVHLPGARWLLCGLTRGGRCLTVWAVKVGDKAVELGGKLAFKTAELQSSVLLSRNFNEETMKVTAIAPAMPELSSAACPSGADTCRLYESAFILTAHADGTVRLWGLIPAADVSEDCTLVQLVAAAVAPRGCVTSLRSACFGRFACVLSSSRDVEIWEFFSNFPTWSRECVLRSKSSAQAEPPAAATSPTAQIDWLQTIDGHFLLAVGSGCDVTVYEEETHRGHDDFKVTWSPADDVAPPRFRIPCSALTWTAGGTLLTSSGQRLFMCSKWTPSINGGHASGSGDITLLFRRARSLHMPLPGYHPKVLIQCLEAGEMERVQVIFKSLLQFLEEKISGGTTAFMVPIKELEQCKRSGMQLFLPADSSPSHDQHGSDDEELRYSDEEKEEKDGEPLQQRWLSAKNLGRLSELISQVSLPGVDRIEQMQILAVVDTLTNLLGLQGALDACGVRFLLAYKIFNHSRHSLSPAQRPECMRPADFAWALHTEAQEVLLQQTLPLDSDWEAARAIGVGFWLTNITLMRAMVERTAKTKFTKNKNPNDAALFYLLLGKKSTLSALYKASKDSTLAQFLDNDFTTEKWKRIAAKNAYKLEGQHRYELSAAMFLLGGSVKDAVLVCLSKLNDVQLALLIARMAENAGAGGTVYQWVLREHILNKAHETRDQALACIVRWLLKEHEQALLELQSAGTTAAAAAPATQGSATASPGSPSAVSSALAAAPASSSESNFNPSILNYFSFLCEQPVLRQLSASSKRDTQLMWRALKTYFFAGCPLLAAGLMPLLEQRAKEAAEETRPKTPLLLPSPRNSPLVASSASPSSDPAIALAFAQPSPPPTPLPTFSFGGFSPNQTPKAAEPAVFGFSLKPTPANDSASDGDFGFSLQPSSSAAATPASSGGGDDWFEDFLSTGPPSKNVTSPSSPSAKPTSLTSSTGSLTPPPDLTKLTQSMLDDLKFAIALSLLQQYLDPLHGTSSVVGCRAIAQRIASEAEQWAQALDVPLASLKTNLVRFCEAHGHLAPALSLRQAFNADFEQSFISYITQLLRHTDALPAALVAHPLTPQHAMRLFIVARELNMCSKVVPQQLWESISATTQCRVTLGIFVGIFVSFWEAKNFNKVAELLEGSDISAASQLLLEEYEKDHNFNDTGDYEPLEEESDGVPKRAKKDQETLRKEAVLENFATKFLASLAVKCFIARLYGYSSKNVIFACDDIKEYITGLAIWEDNLEMNVRKSAPCVVDQQLPSDAAQFQAALGAMLAPTRCLRHNAAFWAFLQQQQKLAPIVHQSAAKLRASMGVLPSRDLTLSDEESLLTDKDILMSFCVSSDSKYACVASRNDVREIDLKAPRRALDDDDSSSPSLLPEEAVLTYFFVDGNPSKPAPDLPSAIPRYMSSAVPLKRSNVVAQWLESHPKYPYYLSAGTDGKVSLWQYTVPSRLANYSVGVNEPINRCRFSPTGTRFSGCDKAGNVAIWSFTAGDVCLSPFYRLKAHNRQCTDLAFLNFGSLIATVGQSKDPTWCEIINAHVVYAITRCGSCCCRAIGFSGAAPNEFRCAATCACGTHCCRRIRHACYRRPNWPALAPASPSHRGINFSSLETRKGPYTRLTYASSRRCRSTNRTLLA
eukprot:TRINITY_DN4557_c0_g1_i2.p1 TRINITY_DN4557_c0_g1~~TRINITY_DN4557_c0_g1_i2.p1  ORF type:complete len:2290 (+),score=469.94 TRINITY_DN4557_c0_g1_i2:945-6872(+)